MLKNEKKLGERDGGKKEKIMELIRTKKFLLLRTVQWLHVLSKLPNCLFIFKLLGKKERKKREEQLFKHQERKASG